MAVAHDIATHHYIIPPQYLRPMVSYLDRTLMVWTTSEFRLSNSSFRSHPHELRPDLD